MANLDNYIQAVQDMHKRTHSGEKVITRVQARRVYDRVVSTPLLNMWMDAHPDKDEFTLEDDEKYARYLYYTREGGVESSVYLQDITEVA